MQKVAIKPGASIADYKNYASLVNKVNHFLEFNKEAVEALKGKTIWMINSTSSGGGVAEMLPSQMTLLRELGVTIEWLVIEANDQHFFDLTKRIHNAIHGSGDGVFTDEDRKVYHAVNQANVEKALSFIQEGDIVVVHDPQPMPLAGMIKKETDVRLIWRCHIGIDKPNETSRKVWDFLSAYYDDYDHFIYSLKSYIPDNLKKEVSIICPAIDPLSHKNRVLPIQKCLGILNQAGVVNTVHSPIYPAFDHQVSRVMPDGSFGQVNAQDEFDIIFCPVITEISRWDRLKGFKELMDAFIELKHSNEKNGDKSSQQYQRIKHAKLILGGPDPKFVSDDPEGLEVLNELIAQYKSINRSLQKDVAILLLPMDNPKENALIVNAIQTVSTIVAQNSIQEGFGLTATEAMWKQRPVLVSGAAGLVHQAKHDEHGKINANPKDIAKLKNTLEEMLQSQKELDNWGYRGQVRVIEKFTLFTQLEEWFSVFMKFR